MHPIIINNICWNDLWRIQRERCFSVLLSRCTRREEFHFCLGYAWIVKQADTVDVVADGTARLQNTFEQNSEIIPPNTLLNRLQERTTHQEPIIHVIVRIQLLLNFHSGRIYHICNQQIFFYFLYLPVLTIYFQFASFVIILMHWNLDWIVFERRQRLSMNFLHAHCSLFDLINGVAQRYSATRKRTKPVFIPWVKEASSIILLY